MRYPPSKSRPAERTRAAPARVKSSTPLGDDRFQELIRGASVFFAAAERDVVAEKAQAIREIQQLMVMHGLSISDLQD